MSLEGLLFQQGFKQHQLHDVLVAPGTADLTTNVNFGAFKRAASTQGSYQCLRSCVVGMILVSFLPTGVGCFGPITQNEFLHKMGIRQRIDVS